ncbi:hypothetical protein KAI87_07670, partial [Myxococcota bacterium]|nr:hypothetical protein [Myxococcota bacterium]
MSSINTRGPNVAPSPTSNPAGQPASGVASTTRAPSATSAQPAMTTPDVASAGAAAIKPPKAKINGLKNLTTTFDSFDLARTSTMTVFTPSDTATGRVERGYVKCEAEAIADGFRLHVKTFHEDKNDKVTLVLQTEVFDPDSNSIQTINLSV